MLKKLTLPLGLALALLAGTALAADPSAHQIYLALRGGNVAQAQQMIQQVLHDHPESAKAHFVAAEVQARAGNYGLARQQLAKAESLKPGLPFASAYAVRELKRQLGLAPGAVRTRAGAAGHRAHLGWALLLIGGVILLWLIVRRRMAMRSGAYPVQMSGAVPPGPMPGGPAGYGPGGYPPGYAAGMAPGAGSGMMHNLGTGLAIGAGMAAGEELVDHMLGGNAVGGMIPGAGAAQAVDPQVNSDLGGNDFGMSDPGSWDDGGGGWDGGGDDGGGWT